ncbi:MAG: xanthine dehydrogenase family protein subunit M [Collimonas pratensis]|uniref:FAD binding domain-containing protein n=1 Tax=Collimonas pratensis TaxID=279113 RepID=UPI003C768CE7
MQTFQIHHPKTTSEAIHIAEASPACRFLAGGTTLVDLMKLDVEQPQQIVDISRLPLALVEQNADGGLTIGAMVRNSDLANHPLVLQYYPVLSQALLSGASPQLRNMATTGGNLLQRTRCVYFRDTAAICNKRNPGSGCAAISGFNRNLAILGTSDHCIASNPSDMNVALTALEATIHVQGNAESRIIPIADFYTLPGNTPHRETVLEAGELITHVKLAAPLPGTRSIYLKLRDRASFEFALVSAAVALVVNGNHINYARVALGGVGCRPWRSPEAEAVLTGAAPSSDTFMRAATAATREAIPRSGNGFKIELVKRCLIQALRSLTSSPSLFARSD